MIAHRGISAWVLLAIVLGACSLLAWASLRFQAWLVRIVNAWDAVIEEVEAL